MFLLLVLVACSGGGGGGGGGINVGIDAPPGIYSGTIGASNHLASGMITSNFLGQYRYDGGTSSWVQENLFAYTGSGADVEGMGFGALSHFWATGWSELYEIGGGDLGGYIPGGNGNGHNVPEPGTLALLGAGLLGLSLVRRRRL